MILTLFLFGWASLCCGLLGAMLAMPGSHAWAPQTARWPLSDMRSPPMWTPIDHEC